MGNSNLTGCPVFLFATSRNRRSDSEALNNHVKDRDSDIPNVSLKWWGWPLMERMDPSSVFGLLSP